MRSILDASSNQSGRHSAVIFRHTQLSRNSNSVDPVSSHLLHNAMCCASVLFFKLQLEKNWKNIPHTHRWSRPIVSSSISYFDPAKRSELTRPRLQPWPWQKKVKRWPTSDRKSQEKHTRLMFKETKKNLFPYFFCYNKIFQEGSFALSLPSIKIIVCTLLR